MSKKKSVRPNRQRVVLSKQTGRWIDIEEERALMELAKIKREQARKLAEEETEILEQALVEARDKTKEKAD